MNFMIFLITFFSLSFPAAPPQLPPTDYFGRPQTADDYAFVIVDEDNASKATFYVNKNLVHQSKTLEDYLEDYQNAPFYPLPNITEEDFVLLYSLLQQSQHPSPNFWRVEKKLNDLVRSVGLIEYWDLTKLRKDLLNELRNYAIHGLLNNDEKVLTGLKKLTPSVREYLIKKVLPFVLNKKPQILGNYITFSEKTKSSLPNVMNDDVVTIEGKTKSANVTFTADTMTIQTQGLTDQPQVYSINVLENPKKAPAGTYKARFNESGTRLFGISPVEINFYPEEEGAISTISNDKFTAFASGPEDIFASGRLSGNVKIYQFKKFPATQYLEERVLHVGLFDFKLNPSGTYAKIIAISPKINNTAMMAIVNSNNHLIVGSFTMNNGTSKFTLLHENSLEHTTPIDMIFANKSKWLILVSNQSLSIVDAATGKEIAYKEVKFGNNVRLQEDEKGNIFIHSSKEKQQLDLQKLIQKYTQLENTKTFDELLKLLKD